MQLHLWVGLAVGLYIVVLSVTGSLSVLRPDVHRWFVPRTVAIEGEKLTGDALQEAVRRVYPGYEVTNVFERRRADTPVMVTLQRDGEIVERLFDPYAARDLGLTYPPITEAIEWVVDLHDNLLGGTTGRMINGIRRVVVSAARDHGRDRLVARRQSSAATRWCRASRPSPRASRAGCTTRSASGCSRSS